MKGALMRPKHLIRTAVLGSAFAVATLPAGALGDSGQAATHTVDTFTEQSGFFGPDECTGKTITGVGTQSVTVTETATSNGGFHDRVEISGSVALYVANGPGPWDPQPGAFVGTWTYDQQISDQAPAQSGGSTTGVSSGPFVLADGTILRRQVLFHITWDLNGPPKLFFAKFICSGGGAA
jgi:hypothetical protein